MPRTNKEIAIEDFNLSPKELADLVRGAQRALPARDEDGSLLDVDAEPETQTS
jgi:hypothetical protein